MLRRIRNFLRSSRHAERYPLLLPHFQIVPGGLQPVYGPMRPFDERTLGALRLCDGTRTLAQVARTARIRRSSLLQQHEDGALLLWRSKIPAPSSLSPVLRGEGRGEGSDVEKLKSPTSFERRDSNFEFSASDPSPLPSPLSTGEREAQLIILSPHPDDAALSLGGRMLNATPGSVLVVNVFSRTAAWRFPDADRHIEQIQAIRREEELLMTRLTGAQLLELELPEALLRGHTQEQAFTADIGQSEYGLADSIAAAISDLAKKHPNAKWELPLGVGNHIDHRLVRDAAVPSLRSAGIPLKRVEFYEDLPYAAKLPRITDFSSFLPGQTLSAEDLTAFNRARKMELLRLYWSQLTWSQIVEVGDYAARRGGPLAVEQSWRLASA